MCEALLVSVRHNNKSSDGTAALQSVSATSMQWVTSITVIVAVAIFGPLGTHARSGGAPTPGACVSLTPVSDGVMVYRALVVTRSSLNTDTSLTTCLYD